MNVKLKVLTAGVLFFTGQALVAQEVKTDSTSLEEKKMGEVVVVGFGRKQAVKESTGAVSSIKASSIEDVPVASVDKMLQGRTTGVQTGSASGQPGGFAAVRVRGVASINGGVNPIYVLDGVRINSGDLTANNTTANILANINPDDIESITVLKDAVSTAVYGADAGAGVIVITTKQGRRGKPRFNMSFSHGFSERAVEAQRGMTADEYRQYLVEAFTNAGIGARPAVVFNSEYDTNWRRETEKKSAYTRNADISMSGGGDRMSYYLSSNYFDQEGIVKASDFKRIAFTSKVDYRATDKLRLGSNIQISYSKINTVSDGGSFSNPLMGQYFLRPTDPVRNADGSLYLGSVASGRMSNSLFNNAVLLEYNKNNAETAKVFANLSADYDIARNLKYRIAFAPEYINVEENLYWNPLHGDGRGYNGYNTTGVRRYFSFNIQNVLSYNFNIGLNNFDFSAIQEAYRTQIRTLAATGTNVGSESLYTLSNFVKMQSMSGTKSQTSRHGYAFTGHYDYDKLVMLDLSYRRDVLSNFTEGRKAGDFWSAGLAVDLARLGFIKEIDAISQLKFRSSYGKIGNQVSATPYALYAYTANYEDQAALTYSGILNRNLSWETVKPFNVGIDFGFFNDRIRLTAEYFNKKTEDLVYNKPLQVSEGLSSYTDNIGSLVNKGFEFTLNTDIFRGGREGFNWGLGFNFSTLKNEITELYGGDVIGGTTILREGESMSTFYLRKWAGVDPTNGAPLWYINGVDGETTSNYNIAQRAVQGSMLNKYYGGLNTNLSYKGFALDAQFTYAFGGKIYDDWARYLYSDGQYTWNYPGYAAQLDYWTPENPNATNPKPIYGNATLSNNASTRFLYKTDFIRLSSAKLSYTFNAEQLRGTGLSSVQVYLLGSNLITWKMDKNLKMDPEIGVTGYSGLNLPIMKTYSIGFNIGF